MPCRHDCTTPCATGLDAIIASARAPRAVPESGAQPRGAPGAAATASVGMHAHTRSDDEEEPNGSAVLRRAFDEDVVNAESSEQSGEETAIRTAPARGSEQDSRFPLSKRVPASSLLRDEAFMADDGSDSSEDERPPKNTVGDVPLEWYKHEEHIGYDRYVSI